MEPRILHVEARNPDSDPLGQPDSAHLQLPASMLSYLGHRRQPEVRLKRTRLARRQVNDLRQHLIVIRPEGGNHRVVSRRGEPIGIRDVPESSENCFGIKRAGSAAD